MLNRVDLARVDLNLLVLLEVLLEEGHVGRAAARLHLSPSAVSHGLGRLRRIFNDPLFLKHPKGVVATDRATSLHEPVARILAQVRQVMASGAAFDAARAERRFAIGAPDAVAAVAIPPVLAEMRDVAPGIQLDVRDVHPNEAFAALDQRRVDVALYPLDEIHARFDAHLLYEEDFVVAARSGHGFGRKVSLERYSAAQHLLVSREGARGFVDDLLEEHGASRRVVLTVPSFMWALAVIGESDLIGTLPRSLVRMHGRRFGVVAVEPPMQVGESRIRAVAPKVAMADGGVAWLVDLLKGVAERIIVPGR